MLTIIININMRTIRYVPNKSKSLGHHFIYSIVKGNWQKTHRNIKTQRRGKEKMMHTKERYKEVVLTKKRKCASE